MSGSQTVCVCVCVCVCVGHEEEETSLYLRTSGGPPRPQGAAFLSEVSAGFDDTKNPYAVSAHTHAHANTHTHTHTHTHTQPNALMGTNLHAHILCKGTRPMGCE